MLHFDPKVLTTFEVFDVFDPDELGNDSRVSNRFPAYNNHNTYNLRNRRSLRDCPDGLLTRLAVRRAGALTVGYISARFGTEVGIVGEGFSRLFLTFPLRGSLSINPGSANEAAASGSKGVVYWGRPETRLLTSDDNRRVTVQIDESAVMRVLESLLGEPCSTVPTFTPAVDWAAPSVAPLVRLVQHLIGELADDRGLCSVPAALQSATDALAALVLTRLRHDYADRLARPQGRPVPRQLRRAEEFIEAHAHQPISVPDIAAAAGCSARALQMAFRQFRDTTPLAALRDARLVAVRNALARTEGVSAWAVARPFGFSNQSRFRIAYHNKFGENPP